MVHGGMGAIPHLSPPATAGSRAGGANVNKGPRKGHKRSQNLSPRCCDAHGGISCALA